MVGPQVAEPVRDVITRESLFSYGYTKMPRYDYRCPSNGAVVEVSHGMNEGLHTWGEVCERAGMEPDGTPADAPVEKLISGGYVMTARRTGSSAASCTKSSCAGCSGCG